MSEEKKDNVSEKEKDKSEKLIYVLTGLLVVVIFGAIAVLYFNPSTDEKVYKPEKIQVAAETKNPNQLEKNINNVSSKSNEGVKRKNEKTDTQKNETAKAVNNQASDNNLTNSSSNNNLTVSSNISSSDEVNSKRIPQQEKFKEKELVKGNEEKKTAKSISNKELKTEGKEKRLEKSKDNNSVVVQKNIKKKENISKSNKEIDKKKTIEKKYYYIQVGALASMEKARKEKAKFEKRGFKNLVIIKEKGLYKILIGRFNSIKEAMNYKRKHNLEEGWIRILKTPVN